MRKRFKTRRAKKPKLIKKFCILFVLYFIFSLCCRTIYSSKINSLSDEELIKYVVKYGKNNTMDIKKNPLSKEEFILKYTLNIDLNKLKETKPKELKIDNVEKNKNNAVVYIYNTHDTEKYSENENNIYNIVPSVKTAAYILQENLNNLGITTIVEEEQVNTILKQNHWAYNRSYDASKILVSQKINTNPDLKLIIDLHRDSSSLEKTLLKENNIEYAKVLFVVGCEHENYQANYNLSQILNNNITELLPNISRGITKKSGAGVNGIYNQDLSQNSVLIEMGGQYNNIEQVNNTMPILAKAILKYLEGE